MRLLTGEQAAEWCAARGIVDASSGRPSLHYPEGKPDAFAVRIPPEAPRALSLAYTLLAAACQDDREDQFGGLFLWLRQWDIWGETAERVAHLILQRLRSPVAGASVEEMPAELFEAHELPDAHAAITHAMLFQWDAFVVSPSGDWFAFVSHDQQLFVLARSELALRHLRKRFNAWKPEQSRPGYLERAV